MIQCPSCGEENPERAKFCLNCANPLTPGSMPSSEVRKTVTILFADIVASTSRGEQTDPESTRRLLTRYFDAIRRIVERHGGTVEKFIGDAVMAVFGIPTLHEDDALRAVRAANDMRVAIELLNQELASASWPPIAMRTGVNTGEVVTGEGAGHTLATGDAVNLAARLEQAAGAGEIVLGAATYRLVHDAVEAEPMPPLELKGKAEPVHAHRLVRVAEHEPMRRHDTPLVGRQRELRLLREAFERATEERECYLFTLLGTAGVGKSRLVHEFLTEMRNQALVLRARCLPYGEGITYWPVIELAQTAAGIEIGEPTESAHRKLEALLADAPERDAILERVAATIGLSETVVPTEEAFWAVRKLLEAIAAERPLIAVIDDLQWAEPTMLDLIDHIADWSRETPIVLLAIARPELLELRPQWGGGKLNAITILLEPLGAEESVTLITNLIEDAGVARTLQERIGETAEGNPLFVEELVAMLVDQGVLRRENGGWSASDLTAVSVPPSISALVAARLDHLEPMERDLIGRASVVGKTFQRAAVSELSPPERRTDLGTRLMTLVRKELVRPDRSTTPGDEAFRFRHLLVRDAAYASLTKEQRADLHARFADWLERIAGERLLEYEEVIAYHLEQAHRYRSELGLTDQLTTELGARAAVRLRSAGDRAGLRNDQHAAKTLLERAIALTTDERERLEMQSSVADFMWQLGDGSGALTTFRQAEEMAHAIGDEILQLRVALARIDMEQMTNPEHDEAEALRIADRLQALGEQQGDRGALASAHVSRAFIYLNHCEWMKNLEELERARRVIQPDQDRRRWAMVTGFTWNALRWGPVPADEAIAQIEADEVDDVLRTIPRLGNTGPLLVMLGKTDEGRARARALIDYYDERGVVVRAGASALDSGSVEVIAGDLEAADREFSAGITRLTEAGETGVLSTLAALRAEVRYRQGRMAEVDGDLELARRTGHPNDIATQAWWRSVAAMVAADDGRQADAERLIGEAEELIDPTDFCELRASTFEARAHVEAVAGRLAGWRAALERAIAEHRIKRNLVGERRIARLLAAGVPEGAAGQAAR